jgi:transitional endoplasmic reticulum ATPase
MLLLGGILILVACTDITVLDDALLRPGRLQHHIKLELPNRSDVKKILEGKMQKLKCSDDVCVEELTSILVNDVDYCVTGADIENVCNRALVHRIREHVLADSQGTLSDENNSKENFTDVSIGMKNFSGALHECFPSLSTDNAKTEEASLPSFAWQGIFTEGLNSNPR